MTDPYGPDRPNRPVGPSPSIVVLAIVLLVVAGSATTAIGAAQTSPDLPAESALYLAVDEDGSARVTLVVPFDLTTNEEDEAFEILRTNATAREQRTERFAIRMQATADRAEANTDRNMQISQPTIDFTERNGTGIVALAVTWEGLAAQSDDELVLREPFASGATLDRSFHVIAPDGYRIGTASPAPTERSRTEATWAAGTSLEGFKVTFATGPPQTVTPTTTDGPGTGADAPGFGIGIAVIALLLSTGFMLYRSRYSP